MLICVSYKSYFPSNIHLPSQMHRGRYVDRSKSVRRTTHQINQRLLATLKRMF